MSSGAIPTAVGTFLESRRDQRGSRAENLGWIAFCNQATVCRVDRATRALAGRTVTFKAHTAVGSVTDFAGHIGFKGLRADGAVRLTVERRVL